MRLFLFELKKIFGERVFIAALLVTSLLSGWLFFSGLNGASDPIDPYLAEYLEYYNKDPAAALAKAENYTTAYETALKESVKDPLLSYAVSFPESEYIRDPEIGTDRQIYRRATEIINYPDTVAAEYSRLLESAEKHITEYKLRGYSESSFVYAYQRQVISAYNALQNNLDFKPAITTYAGYYLGFSADTPVLLAAVLIAGGLILAPERRSGAVALLKASRRGRLPTATAKLLCVPFTSAAAVLAAKLPPLLLALLSGGAAQLSLPVQQLPDYILSPYPVSVLGGSCIKALCAFISSTALVYIMLLASALFSGYIPPFTAGIAASALSLFVSSRRYLSPGSLLNYLNPYSLLTSGSALTGYVGIKFPVFGSLPFLYAVFILYLILYLLLSAAFIAAYLRMPAISAGRFNLREALRTLKEYLRRLLPRKQRKARFAAPRSLGIFNWENRKLIRSAGFLLSVLVLLAGKAFYVSQHPYTIWNDDEYAWKSYMDTYNGEYTPEKQADIDKLPLALSAVINKEEEMERLYYLGEIDRNEYADYLNNLFQAQRKLPVISRLRDRASYLKECTENGDRAYFLYDSGWERLFCKQRGDMLLMLFAALIPLFAFSGDYHTGFRRLMKTTQRGNKPSFIAKSTAVLITVNSGALLFFAADIVRIISDIGLPEVLYPAQSLPLFASAQGSLLKYAVILYFLKLLAVNGAALISLSVSCIIGSLTLSGAVSLTVLFLPELFSILGYGFFDRFSAVAVLAPKVYESAAYKAPLLLLAFALLLYGAAFLSYCGIPYTNRRKENK